MLQTFFSLHVATMEKKKLRWLNGLSVFDLSSTRIWDILIQRDVDNLGLVLKDNARAVSVNCSVKVEFADRCTRSVYARRYSGS